MQPDRDLTVYLPEAPATDREQQRLNRLFLEWEVAEYQADYDECCEALLFLQEHLGTRAAVLTDEWIATTQRLASTYGREFAVRVCRSVMARGLARLRGIRG